MGRNEGGHVYVSVFRIVRNTLDSSTCLFTNVCRHVIRSNYKGEIGVWQREVAPWNPNSCHARAHGIEATEKPLYASDMYADFPLVSPHGADRWTIPLRFVQIVSAEDAHCQYETTEKIFCVFIFGQK